jgi:thiamine kinase-like enzyme
MLSQDQVLRYLVARGLLRPATIVEGDLVVEAVPRHNSNFKIISQRGPCYLVKQGSESGGIGTVSYEATVYELLSAPSAGASRRDLLPRYYSYDPDQRVLVLELYSDAQNLREHHVRRNRFPASTAALAGQALGTLHATARMDGLYDRLSHRPPEILAIHRPGLELFQHLSPANRHVVKTIQGLPELVETLESLRRGWQVSSLIHGDLRWDNCLITRRTPRGRPYRLHIVDWEFAAFGDPCWDAGSVFAEYLSYWLLAVPSASDLPPERLLEISPVRLEHVQPAMRAFWRAYRSCLQLEPVAEAAWLLRAAQYAAARLIERAAEQLHRSNQLTGQIVYLLQAGMNILQRPQDAVGQLLGIG